MYWYGTEYKSPSKRFGNAIGLVLHNDWGLSDQPILQGELRCPNTKMANFKFSNDLYSKLDLPIAITDIQKFDAVFGAISQFMFDDIKYFLEVPWNMRGRMHQFREDRIEQSCGHEINWVASPETMTKIERHLGLTSPKLSI